MFNKTLIASALAAALVTTPAFAAGDRMSDTWKEASIATAYTLNSHLNPFDIDVEVRDGVAYLQGVVESDVESALAAQIASSVDGVKKVENNLRVMGEVGRVDARKGFARTVEDATITARVKSQLLWNQSTGGLDINVTTESGVVHLAGVVQSDTERDLVQHIARNTEGVVGLTDNLTVDASDKASAGSEIKKDVKSTVVNVKNSAEKSAKSVERVVSDTWVTTKVKTALLYNRAVDGTDIEVETDKGIVTLTGTVADEAELHRAINLARQVTGVKEVRAALKVVPSSS